MRLSAPTGQQVLFAGVALLMILAIGAWSTRAAAWLLGLILLAVLLFRWEQLRAALYGR